MNIDGESKITWDKAYDPISSETLWGETPVPFVKTAIDYFQSINSKNVLDLPCGDGRNSIPLAEAFQNLTAADYSLNALENASKTFKNQNLNNCLLMKADIFNTPFFNEQFDGVFCCDVLGHLMKPIPAIKEMIRICKCQGIIIGNFFAMGDSTRGLNMERIQNEEYIFDNRFYFKFYEKENVHNILTKFDVKILDITSYNWEEPPHSGYREYPHEHQSWVFVIQKEGGYNEL